MSDVQTSISLLALSVLVESLMSRYLGRQLPTEAKLTKIAKQGAWEGQDVKRLPWILVTRNCRCDATVCWDIRNLELGFHPMTAWVGSVRRASG